MRRAFFSLKDDILLWQRGWYLWAERKLRRFGRWFELRKNVLVTILMARRGSYQRPFLHVSIVVLVILGIVSSPFVNKSGLPGNLSDFTPSSAVLASFDLSEYGVQTQESRKPRDQVEVYVVRPGDTLGKIAETFGISIDTVRWSNDLKSDSLSVGQEVKIPPVTGIVHKVRDGESIYSIAKKYKTDAQKIANWPFNDFADLDTFALTVGQTLIVPDGVQPEAAPIALPAPSVVAIRGTGQFLWPTAGVITQYPIWYHMAFDIANPAGPGIWAADAGTVILVQYLRYGYGQHIIVDHGNGFQTLYAHLQEIYVKAGDRVSRGQVMGRMGSTGRSTGTHLHFEVRKNGVPVNPTQFFR